MAARKGLINLLPKSEFELSYWGRFLKWALTRGREIIILTEIVVIAAFLSRFKFDQDLADLSEAVERKLVILKQTERTEENFRNVQNRLEATANLLSGQNRPSFALEEMAATMPSQMKLLSVSMNQGELVVTAEAENEIEVGSFLGRLAKKWKMVELVEIATNSEARVRFTFRANM